MGRGISGSEDGCFGNTVQSSSSGAETAIGYVAGIPSLLGCKHALST